jgi:uncharacterized protein CbrC (UPF0167 family)
MANPLSADEVIPVQAPLTPVCCGEETTFVMREGIEDIRRYGPEMMRALHLHILHEMHISGSAAPRLLGSLDRDSAPAAVVYRCPRCGRHHFRIDQN